MGCLEGINRRGAWAKPLTSLPTADTACTTEKSQISVRPWLGISDHEAIFGARLNSLFRVSDNISVPKSVSQCSGQKNMYCIDFSCVRNIVTSDLKKV